MAKIHSRRVISPFLIGIFVILGTFSLIGVIIWLGAVQFLKEQVYYVSYFPGSVEGLEKGSAVKYLGVPCGSVKSINVAPDGKLVEVVMQLDPKLNIDDSLRVQLALAGIAGGKFLQLFYPSSPDLSELSPSYQFEPPYPVIKSTPSGLEELEIAARDVMNNLMQLKVKEISAGTIGFLGSTTKFFNSPELYQIMANLERTSESLQKVMQSADTSQIISNLESFTNVLLQTSQKLDMLAENLQNQADAMDLPGYISKIYDRYDSTIANANYAISLIGYRSEDLLITLAETLEQIKATNKRLRRTLSAISENPSQVFFSEPPPKEK